MTIQQPRTSLNAPSITPIARTPSRAPTPRLLQVYTPSQSQTPSRSTTTRHRPSSSIHTPQPNLASHERYNAPLAASPVWTSKNKIWTPIQLHRERQDFFETRVTGRPEIWDALQNVCELVRDGDVATAQGILDAAGVTLPTGSLVDGCYDEVGNLYKLPEVVVSDPVNTGVDAGDGEELRAHRFRNSNNIDGETMIGVSESKIAPAAEEKLLGGEGGGAGTDVTELSGRRRGGKRKESEQDAVNVRCRLSDRGGTDVIIAMEKTQNVGTLARKVEMEGKVGHSSFIAVFIETFCAVQTGQSVVVAKPWLGSGDRLQFYRCRLPSASVWPT